MKTNMILDVIIDFKDSILQIESLINQSSLNDEEKENIHVAIAEIINNKILKHVNELTEFQTKMEPHEC